ncbi:RhoGEF domain-containing protein [Legionella adelaidensis]|uniref:RhoGEF domain-containing protein n=1 Tax=Legionella adelaidensis TaxID=45056 RepID=UPI001040EF38|nr:RhoGEF domain-containing protein [Legionella adelaidensis]
MPISEDISKLLTQQQQQLDRFFKTRILPVENKIRELQAQVKATQDEQEIDSLKEQIKDLNAQKQPLRVAWEFYNTERTFITNLQRMHNILSDPTVLDKLSSKDRQSMETYTRSLEDMLTHYHNENFTAPIANENASTHQIIADMHQQINSDDFKNHIEKLKPLILPYERDLQPLFKRNPKFAKAVNSMSIKEDDNLSFEGRLITPAQRGPRYPLLLGELEKTVSAYAKRENTEEARKAEQLAGESLDQAKHYAGSINIAQGIKDVHDKSKDQLDHLSAKEKKGVALQSILSLNLNTSLQQDKQLEVEFKSQYIEHMLANAYPETFYHDQSGKFQVKAHSPEQYLNVYKALSGTSQLQKLKDFSLDPKNFDAKSLDALYKEDKNPVWLVLKSTKPVSEDFTAAEKIRAYEQVAEEFKKGAIVDTGKYLGVESMAKAAVAVANAHPEVKKQVEETFGEHSELGQYVLDKYIEHNSKKESQAKTEEYNTMMSSATVGPVDIAPLVEPSIPEVDRISTQASFDGLILDSQEEEERESATVQTSMQTDQTIEPKKYDEDRPQIEPILNSPTDINASSIAENIDEAIAFPLEMQEMNTDIPSSPTEINESSAVEPAAVEPAVVEPAVVEPAVVEPAVVEPAVVESAVVEPAAVEPVPIPGFKKSLSASSHTLGETTIMPEVSIERFRNCKNNMNGLREDSARETIEALNNFFTKFNGTNSDGVEKIKKTIQDEMRNPDKSSIEKLDAINKVMKATSEQKTGIGSWYSKSHIFGQGRTEGVQALYDHLKGNQIKNVEDVIKLDKQIIGDKPILHEQSGNARSMR